MSLAYRRDIDGLRGVAVIIVMLYHLGWISAGFIGVDVFFVISGYLITGLIWSDVCEERFTFAGFYGRRARRILPALIVVVTVSAIAGYVLLYPSDYVTFGRSALSALFGISNFYFFSNTGYFDIPAQSMPLLHTWSLGVEEQFYLVWPALLIVANKYIGPSRKSMCTFLLLIAIASFVAGLLQFHSDPKAAFYLPYARAWELAFGGILIFLPQSTSSAMQILPGLGLGLIGFSTRIPNAAVLFANSNVLLATVGAALIVYPHSTVVGRKLAILAPIGLISYSLYLWHWPLIAFWRVYSNAKQLGWLDGGAIAVASVCLSILSWAFIEQPVRKSRWRLTVPALLSLGLAGACAAGLIVSTAGFPARVSPLFARLDNKTETWNWACSQTTDIGLLLYPDTSGSHPTCVIGLPWNSARYHAVIWGDSIAEAVLPLFNIEALRHQTSIALINPCPAILRTGVAERYWPEIPSYNQYCSASAEAALKLINGNQIDRVFLVASWSKLARLMSKNGVGPLALPEGERQMKTGFDDLFSRLREATQVVIFADFPQWGVADPVPCVPELRSLPRKQCLLDGQFWSTYEKPVTDFLKSTALEHNAEFYDPAKYLCGVTGCEPFVNGEFMYRDAVHLRRDLQVETEQQLVALLKLDTIFPAVP